MNFTKLYLIPGFLFVLFFNFNYLNSMEESSLDTEIKKPFAPVCINMDQKNLENLKNFLEEKNNEQLWVLYSQLIDLILQKDILEIKNFLTINKLNLNGNLKIEISHYFYADQFDLNIGAVFKEYYDILEDLDEENTVETQVPCFDICTIQESCLDLNQRFEHFTPVLKDLFLALGFNVTIKKIPSSPCVRREHDRS